MKNNNQTNALSLFDGMSCFQIALKELNIKIDNYYASEVDKHAIAQTKHAFPNTIHLGDVRDIDVMKLPYISILGGGSPCQSFSFAGKMKGMSTKENIKILELDHYLELKSKQFEFEGQSYLFWEYMRILRDIQNYNPDVEFLLENVVMTKDWELVLSRAIGIAPIMINAALVSAQNRKRLFWTNIYNFPQGLLGDSVCEIPQPKDQGILLKDILEPEVDEKYYLSDKMVNIITKYGAIDTLDNEKSNTILASYHKMGGRDQQYIDNGVIKIDKQGNVKQNQDKASCFTAWGNSGGNHSDMDLIVVGNKDNLVMQINPSKESNGKQPFQQNRIYDSEGISPALYVNKADLLITDKISDYQQDNPTHIDKDKHPTLRANAGGKLRGIGITIPEATETKFMQLTKDFRIRRLTPKECQRLQTVPEWYSWGNTSDTQIYRMLGNGWSIEVIKHILSYSNLNKK